MTMEQLLAIQLPLVDTGEGPPPVDTRHYLVHRLQKRDGTITPYTYRQCLTVDIFPDGAADWHVSVSIHRMDSLIPVNLWTEKQRVQVVSVMNTALRKEDGSYVGKGPKHQKIMKTSKTWSLFVPLTEEEREYLNVFSGIMAPPVR